MESFSALLAICAGNSPVPGEFLAQTPVTCKFDVFYLRLNKRLSKQSWCWWFETLSRPLWRHCNATNKCFRIKLWVVIIMRSYFICHGGSVNTLRPIQNGRHFFQTTFWNAFSWMNSFVFWWQFHVQLQILLALSKVTTIAEPTVLVRIFIHGSYSAFYSLHYNAYKCYWEDGYLYTKL